MMTNITTAVDSLVRFVNRKGKIGLDEASKELGIPANILNEWSTFLDQENIIKLEYKFTTPFLVSIRKGNETVEEIDIDSDLLLRKLQIMQAYINKSEPKQNKQIKEKEYLLKEINKLMEIITKKKIIQDDKEKIKKLAEYYKIYKESIKKQESEKDIITKRLEEMYDFVRKSKPKTTKKTKQKEYLTKEINKLLENKKVPTEKIKKLARYYNIYKKG